MGSDESHFNVSVGSDGQSHRTMSTNHNLFEENSDFLCNLLSSVPPAKENSDFLCSLLSSVPPAKDNSDFLCSLLSSVPRSGFTEYPAVTSAT